MSMYSFISWQNTTFYENTFRHAWSRTNYEHNIILSRGTLQKSHNTLHLALRATHKIKMRGLRRLWMRLEKKREKRESEGTFSLLPEERDEEHANGCTHHQGFAIFLILMHLCIRLGGLCNFYCMTQGHIRCSLQRTFDWYHPGDNNNCAPAHNFHVRWAFR